MPQTVVQILSGLSTNECTACNGASKVCEGSPTTCDSCKARFFKHPAQPSCSTTYPDGSYKGPSQITKMSFRVPYASVAASYSIELTAKWFYDKLYSHSSNDIS